MHPPECSHLVQESAQGADALLVLASLAQDQLEDPPLPGRGAAPGQQPGLHPNQPAAAPGRAWSHSHKHWVCSFGHGLGLLTKALP